MDRSVNWTVNGAYPIMGDAANNANGVVPDGLTWMYAFLVRVSSPPLLPTVSDTVYVPGMRYE